MLQKLLKFLDRIKPAEIVYAHCDIPCGIYTTEAAKTAAQTVEKMVAKLNELTPPNSSASKEEILKFQNASQRMIQEKEDQAQICKTELLILWTDYFSSGGKDNHLEMFPNLHEIFWKAAKLCSMNKQGIDIKAASELREAVAEIDRMFQQAETAKKR